ncbi:MAG TPA: hypothetical protein VN857_05265 [Chthoniobacterales bacterium]|nr:hypothetical protein [Chthoniobacterales bacterium]
MTVGTGQARTFCNDEISYGRSSGPDTSVQVSSLIAGHGIELFRLAKEKGLEGIMAKRLVDGLAQVLQQVVAQRANSEEVDSCQPNQA